MKLIVGLGNPGEKYTNTRHNVGFVFVGNYFAELASAEWKNQPDFYSLIAYGSKNDIKISLLLPQTFMNESGKAVKKFCDFYKLDITKDLLVIHDDTDLPLGTIRTTDSSSAAGHNGVQDIIDKLGTQDFYRIRIGVESRASRNDLPTDAFVLQNFTAEEIKKLQEDVFPKVKVEIEKFISR